MTNYIEVSKERFYAAIGPHDVVCEVASKTYPYTFIFRTRYGEQEVGRVVPTDEPGYPPPERYLITSDWHARHSTQ